MCMQCPHFEHDGDTQDVCFATAEQCRLTTPRSLRTIAQEVRSDWKNVWFGAKPYLDAMETLDSVDDNYYLDSGVSIVLYFLANAQTWTGDKARAIKAELKNAVGRSYR